MWIRTEEAIVGDLVTFNNGDGKESIMFVCGTIPDECPYGELWLKVFIVKDGMISSFTCHKNLNIFLVSRANELS